MAGNHPLRLETRYQLRCARIMLHLRQHDVARMSGVHHKIISKMERRNFWLANTADTEQIQRVQEALEAWGVVFEADSGVRYTPDRLRRMVEHHTIAVEVR